MLWDESTDDLVLAGASKLYLYDAAGGEYLSSSGSALTIASGGIAWELPVADGSDGQLLKTDGSGNLDWTTVSGTITALNNQSANRLTTIGSTTTELDGEANLTFTGSALTCIGTVTVGVDNTGHDVKYFGATSGSYWLWDESADGVVQIGTLTVGVDDAGHDVKLFGDSAGAYMEWDTSADQLRIMGASADATTSTGKLLLATSLTDINANDVIGKIEFQAPHEAGGTDAITVAASIQALAQATFSSSVNATDLIFYTGHSEANTEKFRFTSQGELGVGGANYGTDGQILTSTGAGTAPAWEDAAAGGISMGKAIAAAIVFG